ncbi:MAG: TIGR03087 family PEP-CTERM/XrtA system glycosyltransferase [Rhodocyclaceae bacterium]|uniref:TIGR03087 family PEP-CTERM/XrtA system glycosyltransferase n=1 Tax=Accumulibacter sp. TaxID=2053492 RepID=UPI001A62E21A|nr:TIGR03087 family PEP-CTERM/XrtA system glycosyltransferase [Accumulibacter sp.]MBL8495645.1 TIGR03087 family PEP-CTERM/XrtA system glycosyltransferase [Rhodocyclaceae bacterium]HMV56144.1 TIGR03087 family PEP-CTERM/XrtA system glycosyltransferase [Nitrospira sp.]HNB66619.1 TIGR03087 family PEP-CTERM/XrtA system glycosyltransferase [Accumulibacter sp.]
MRVLVLAHRMPFPPNKGDKIRSFNIVEHLARRHDVALACLVDDGGDLRHVDTMRRRVGRFAFERIRPLIKKLWSLSSMLRGQPISVGFFYSRQLQREVDEIIATGIDAVLCICSPMAEYVFRSRHLANPSRHIVLIMDLIDIDSCKWGQYARQKPFWTSWIYRYEAVHLARYERRIAETFDELTVVSEQEMRMFPGGLQLPNLHAMSNGVDLAYFQPDGQTKAANAPPIIAFTGAMDYWPNVEGVRWFAENVFPLVRRELPAAELYIVGSNPVREVQRLEESEGITVTGYVDDVRDYLNLADVCIAPLMIARGIQNKVLEAMAMGKPVVCTPEALEGIAATPGQHLVVASGVADFATATVSLLCDRERATRIGASARARVEAHYSWHANLRLLDRLLGDGASDCAVDPDDEIVGESSNAQ